MNFFEDFKLFSSYDDAMLKALFEEQQKHLNDFFKCIDLQKAEAFFQRCLQCRGLLIFSGIGKSGIIAEKIAMTLISTGTKALYLPPYNFLHGDIGVVSQEDLVIFMSKSGETEELLALVPFIKKRGAQLMSLISNPHSRLAKVVDFSLNLPVEKELCPFDLAPTTSTTVQLIFGDALAIALMKAKGFALDQYALAHPAGTLGKKMTVRVEDLMKRGEDIPLCRAGDRLVDMLVELSNKRAGCLLVVDEDDTLLGIFTDGDLRRALQMKGSQVLEEKMDALMTATPISATKEILAWEAVKIMQKDPKKWILVLPILEKKKVVGLLRMHDVIQEGIV